MAVEKNRPHLETSYARYIKALSIKTDVSAENDISRLNFDLHNDLKRARWRDPAHRDEYKSNKGIFPAIHIAMRYVPFLHKIFYKRLNEKL